MFTVPEFPSHSLKPELSVAEPFWLLAVKLVPNEVLPMLKKENVPTATEPVSVKPEGPVKE